MKNEEMTLRTKQALAAALKAAMLKKPLSKVTVSELITACDINRKTFYYHFADIYDLLKWMLEQEAIDVVKKIDLLVKTEEAVRFVVDYVEQNRHILNCAYDSMGNEEMKRFFYSDLIGVMRHAIDEVERELDISADGEYKDFLAAFYTEALAGMLITWLKRRQETGQEQLIKNVMTVCRVSMPCLVKARAEQRGGINAPSEE